MVLLLLLFNLILPVRHWKRYTEGVKPVEHAYLKPWEPIRIKRGRRTIKFLI